MLSNISIGQYYPTGSIIHKLDPRVKIFFTFVFMISVFLIDRYFAYLIAGIFLLTLIKMSKVPLGFVLKGIKGILYLIIFTFVINIIFTQGDTVLFKYGLLTITKEGLDFAVFMALRLFFLMVGTSLLTLTTSPIELTDALEKIFSPLARFGFPAQELAMMITIALRFIPTLLDETDKIMKAQMARGADFESKNVISRAKSMIPILVPLFVSAFRRADELAMAMEARCYGSDIKRTKMKQTSYKQRDFNAYFLLVAFFVLMIVTGRNDLWTKITSLI